MIGKKNMEGYADLTAYHALAKIGQEERAARFRPLVYICSPFSGDTCGNTKRARLYSRFAVDKGAHTHTLARTCRGTHIHKHI